MSKQRLEAFSDGVFAIAITLLILTIAQPTNYHDLQHDIVARLRLLTPAFPETERRPASLAFSIGVVFYSASIGVAFVNAYACLAFHALLAVYYALDPLSRRAARTSS